jgi:hypothetical protein
MGQGLNFYAGWCSFSRFSQLETITPTTSKYENSLNSVIGKQIEVEALAG